MTFKTTYIFISILILLLTGLIAKKRHKPCHETILRELFFLGVGFLFLCPSWYTGNSLYLLHDEITSIPPMLGEILESYDSNSPQNILTVFLWGIVWAPFFFLLFKSLIFEALHKEVFEEKEAIILYMNVLSAITLFLFDLSFSLQDWLVKEIIWFIFSLILIPYLQGKSFFDIKYPFYKGIFEDQNKQYWENFPDGAFLKDILKEVKRETLWKWFVYYIVMTGVLVGGMVWAVL